MQRRAEHLLRHAELALGECPEVAWCSAPLVFSEGRSPVMLRRNHRPGASQQETVQR